MTAEIRWRHNIKRPNSFPHDLGVASHGEYTVHHQPNGFYVVRYYSNAPNVGSIGFEPCDLHTAMALIKAHNESQN